MRPLRVRITFEVALGVVLIASLVTILHQSLRLAENQRRHEADVQTLRMLRNVLSEKSQEKAPEAAPGEISPAQFGAAIAKREATIAQLDRELAQDRSTITDLQNQLSSANDQNTKAQASAQANFQKQQADAQAQLADLQKKLDAAISESEIARQRAAALESDNARLLNSSTSASSRAADVAHIISSLQDLDRRRDVYMTSILRRYRDITGEFSAMSSMLDTSHDGNSSPCGGATLGRIQNAVSMAQDDLNQLSELNARIQKLEKQLSKK